MKKFSFEAKPWLCFLFLSIFSTITCNSQECETYSGQVMDNNTEPLPYAVVSDLNNQSTRDTTDFNGYFNLISSEDIDSLLIQYIGLKPQTIKAECNLTITLEFIPKDSIKIIQGGRGIVSPFQIPRAPIVPLPPVRVISRRFMQNPLGSDVFPVSEIGSKEINGTNSFSMQDALNLIPGVQMDSRGYNGSRRLNLRGTIARSPFGVRNVRLNLNGFPLTSSDGSSALELLEPSEINLLSVYKGPSGSFEMPGTGGVLSASLLSVYNRKLRAELTYGQFNFFRAAVGVNFGAQKLRSRVSLVHSFNDGYRAQEANNKTQLTVSSTFNPQNYKLKYDALFMLYDGYWELPGHITLDQVNENPRLSNPFSNSLDAHVHRKRAYLGLNQSYSVNNKLRNDTKVFGQISTKYNPYGTNPAFFQGIKDENSFDLGVRSEFNYTPFNSGFRAKLRAKFGTQWQTFQTTIEEFNNIQGSKGDSKYVNNTSITEGLFFASASYNPNEKLSAAVQLGYNLYGLENSGSNSAENTLDFSTKMTGALLPRIGVNYKLRDHSKVGLSYSEGLGYPSIFEWVDVKTGIFSPTLLPESSNNLEFVASHKVYKQKFEWDLKASVYAGKVKNTITENSDSNDAIFYKNEGTTIQNGFEFQGSFTRILDFRNSWGIYSTLTLNDYRFLNDTTDTKLRMTGIPGLTSVLGVNYTNKNWKADISGRFVSEIASEVGPDTNPNTDYVLVNAKLSRRFNSQKPWTYFLEVGANNLLNQTYTSFYKLNASGKIYNPMPSLNGFISFKVNFE